jgi:hypothetical protein
MKCLSISDLLVPERRSNNPARDRRTPPGAGKQNNHQPGSDGGYRCTVEIFVRFLPLRHGEGGEITEDCKDTER